MYFTKDELRRAARATTSLEAHRVLKEEVVASKTLHYFDVFLCHASADDQIVLGAKHRLEEAGLSVYVDWIEDKVDHGTITKATAEQLRGRMRECNSLIFLASKSAPASVWMPWELGYFDGMGRSVAIFPAVDTPADAFTDHQFLQLYPTIQKSTFMDIRGRRQAIVMKEGKEVRMPEFAKRR